MQDRSFQDNPDHQGKKTILSYKIAPKIWTITYDIDTDETIKGTKPSEEYQEKFTKHTPFQQYRIFVSPDAEENKNLHFDRNLVDITIKFYIQIIYIG